MPDNSDTIQRFIHADKLRSTSGHLSRLGLPVLGIDFKFGVELRQFPVNFTLPRFKKGLPRQRSANFRQIVPLF